MKLEEEDLETTAEGPQAWRGAESREEVIPPRWSREGEAPHVGGARTLISLHRGHKTTQSA